MEVESLLVSKISVYYTVACVLRLFL